VEGGLPLRPVRGYPAALAGRTLFLADLHIGIERDYWRMGVRVSGLSRKARELVERVLDVTNPRRIVVVGDLKHNVPDFTRREAQEVQAVFTLMEGQGEVIIVKGNHDGDLEAILPRATIVQGSGIRVGRIFCFHGHAWPDPDIFEAELAVMGHVHPAITLKHAFWSYTDKCWVFTKLRGEALAGRYEGAKDLPLVVVPAFSPIITGSNILDRDQWIGPIGENRAFEAPFDVFLLDGTYVGKMCPSPQGGAHQGG